MALTVTHAKTNDIADWTQADLDAQIALGNFPPGTLLADIVLPSDWNSNHSITGTIDESQLPTGINANKIADGSVSNTEFQYINSLTSNAQTQLDVLNLNNFYAEDYGVIADGIVLDDVTTNATSTTISSGSYTFTSADHNKIITVTNAGATSTSPLNAVINSTSAGSAILSVAAGQSIAGTGKATFGTKNNLLIDAACVAAAAAGGGNVILPAGIMVVSDSIDCLSNVSIIGQGANKSILKWISTVSMTNAVIQGLSATRLLPYYDCRYADFEIDCEAATQSSYDVKGKAFYMQYMTRPIIERVVMKGTPATSIGIDFCAGYVVRDCWIYNAGRLNNGTSDPGGAGIGIGTRGDLIQITLGNTEQDNYIVANNNIFNAKRYGIFYETQDGDLSNTYSVTTGNIIYMGSTSLAGIGDCGTRGAVITSNRIIGSGSGSSVGVLINAGTLGNSIPGVQGLIADNVINKCGTVGVKLDYSVNAEAEPMSYKISNNSISDCNTHGIQIITATSGTPLVDGISISDNEIFLNQYGGIIFTGTGDAKNITIRDNNIYGNGIAGSGVRDGISIAVDIDRINIFDNDITDTQAVPTQRYGIQIAGAITNAFVMTNNLTGNATSAVNITGSLSGEVKGNLGYNDPLLDDITGLITAGTNVTITGTGAPGDAYVINSSGGGGSSAFSALTGSTNTTAAMVVGTGASLGVSGSGTITATSVVAVDAGGDTTTFPLLAGAATGSTGPLTDAGLTYNATTNELTTTTFIGALSGNASTASSAAALTTPRTIGGVSFNGTANIVPQTIESANEAADTTCFPLFITASGTQQLQPKNNTTFTFNASTSALGVTSVVVGGTGLSVGSSVPFSDSAGTLTLQNVDALDATTESTIEAAIDTLANLTSIQGKSVTVSGTTDISGTNTGDQFIFKTISVSGQSDVVADTTSDTLTFEAGANITITTNATTDTVTIAASGSTGQAAIQFQDEGSNLGTSGTIDTIDFTGTGITASRVSNTLTINSSGGGGGVSLGVIQQVRIGAYL